MAIFQLAITSFGIIDFLFSLMRQKSLENGLGVSLDHAEVITKREILELRATLQQ